MGVEDRAGISKALMVNSGYQVLSCHWRLGTECALQGQIRAKQLLVAACPFLSSRVQFRGRQISAQILSL